MLPRRCYDAHMDSWYLFVFTTLASTEGFVVVAGIALILLAVQHAREARCFLVASLGLVLTTALLKETIQTPRPLDGLIEAAGYAFPSGHAAGAFFLAVSFAHMARHLPLPLRIVVYALLASLAFAIAQSRLYLGVHSLFQVFAGALIGILFGLMYILLSQKKFGQ